MAQALSSRTRAAPAEPAPPSPLDFLFVDDDPYCRRLFERMCRRSGLRASTEAGAESALEKMALEGPPLVLVTDVSMPGMSGVELVRRAVELCPETAIVLVTGRTELVIDELEPNPLVVSVVEKPWKAEHVLGVLDRARDMARRRRGEDVTVDLSEVPRGVLIVDGDPHFLKLAEEAARAFGPVRIAPRLGVAIELLRKESFDLVVSELDLSDARGVDAAERLSQAAPELPLVLVSQLEDQQLAKQVLRLGAEDVVHKGRCTVGELGRRLRFAVERSRARAQRIEASFRDSLTGLAPRDALQHRLTSMANAGRPYSVVFVDVDRFRSVNERLGLEAGDDLLRELAERVGETVGPSDLVARRGGDEFIILLDGDESRAREVVQAILTKCRAPVWIHGQALSVTVSVGVASSGEAGAGLDLMAAADRALHEQKQRGRDGWRRASARPRKLGSGPSIHEALTRKELRLLYQPLWSLRRSQVQGFEALLRWEPKRGPGSTPDRFIPELEADGGIVDVGAWVMDQACAQMASEGRLLPPHSRLSVNVSPRQLQGDEILETIERALAEHALDPERLQIEITETVLLPDASDVTRRLQALKKMGVRIALDDFGVGYSSLGHLHRHPIDTVKIDRSLITAVETDERARLIVSSIATLGDKLGMTTVAEGVEWASQLALLREAGCSAAQGYLLGRPAPSWTSSGLETEGATLLDLRPVGPQRR
ncbi:MAG: EAL domain-containing protein [Myxococcota bacterium]